MERSNGEGISISLKEIRAISKDPEKTASAVRLVYVHDSQAGITRIKKGNNFIYTCGNKRVTDKKILDRIKSLVIPPAWENVWICNSEHGHLQATGIDVK